MISFLGNLSLVEIISLLPKVIHLNAETPALLFIYAKHTIHFYIPFMLPKSKSISEKIKPKKNYSGLLSDNDISKTCTALQGKDIMIVVKAMLNFITSKQTHCSHQV